MRNRKTSTSEQGFSIVSTLVAMAISGVVLVAVVKTHQNVNGVSAKASVSQGFQSIRHKVLTQLNCAETANLCAAPTPPNSYVPLQRQGRDLFKGFSAGGNFFVRAKCGTGADGNPAVASIQVSRRQTYAGPPLPGVVNKSKTYKWRPMFAADPAPCANAAAIDRCEYYADDKVVDFSGGFNPRTNPFCNWAVHKDDCKCPDGLSLEGVDYFLCLGVSGNFDDNFYRARCRCCDA